MNKLLPLLLVPIILTGCGHSQHGIRGYATVTDVEGKQRSVLLGSINADIPGAKKVSIGETLIEIDPNVSYTKKTYNATGQVTSEATLPGGVYVSEVTLAQGQADKSRIASGGDTALKTLFGIALPSLGSEVFGYLGNFFK